MTVRDAAGPDGIILQPRSGWQFLDVAELWRARELFAFLVWRDVRIRYKQTALGALWAVLQPLMAMLVFTAVFNRVAGIRSDQAPYPLFAYTGLTLWTFFTNAVSMSSNSLVGNQALVSKVYFPRVLIPLAAVAALLVDLAVSLSLIAVLMLWYRIPPAPTAPLALLYVAAAVAAAGGLGLILSALNVRFRDVKYAVPFFVQMGLFVTPVIYPVVYLPAQWRWLIGLNPMAGVIEGFRSALLGGAPDWRLVAASLAVTAAALIGGLLVFRRMERRFADII
jgi:lipopolysaccharide transport system permease protein